MPADDKTIAVYDAQVRAYEKAFPVSEDDPSLLRFLRGLPAGGRVLDLGCGPGKHASAMQRHGFQVAAIDASAAMVEQARARKGIDVQQAEFEDLDDEAIYDGVWANFSLLHAPREDFTAHLARIAAALKPGGIVHIGMKIGLGHRRDHLGRYYTYYTSQDLKERLGGAGFQVLGETTGEDAGFAGTIDPWTEILSRLER